MNRLHRGIRFLPLFACLVSVSCATQRMAEKPFQFERAPLSGMVYDTENNPVPSVVILVDGKRAAESDVYGRFLIPELERGEHSVTASRERFEPLEIPFNFLNKTHILYLRMTSFDSLIATAETALQDSDWRTAEQLLLRAGKTGSDAELPVVMFLNAVLSYRRHEDGKALGYLDRILEAGYRLPVVYLLMADIHEYGLEDRAAAAQDLEEYLRLRGSPVVETRLRRLRQDL